MTKSEALQDLLFKYSEAESAKYHLEKAVIEAHNQGASWAEIADKLYVSKQTAYNRYNDKVTMARKMAKWREEHPEEAAAAREKGRAEYARMLEEAQEERAAETTKTPSKKIDAQSPALEPAPSVHGTRTEEVFKQFAADRAKAKAERGTCDRNGRIYYAIEDPELTAQPGTGKGPHQCPNCGDTNHKTEWRDTAAFDGACTPTKYDDKKITDLMNTTLKGEKA